jgi:sulfatase maturation enzyme AslB (radical SAM superfamily)
MKKLIKLENTKDFLFVYWQLTDFCNFKCNYCSPVLNEGNFAIKQKEKIPSNDTIKFFIETLKEYKKNKDIYISLSGGEPTLHPFFSEIVELVHPFSNIELITNGSRSISWWSSLKKLPHLIRISLHPEFTEIEKINKLSHFILSTGSSLRFNLSMDTKNWDQSIEMYNQLDPNLKKFVKPKVLHDWSNKHKPMQHYSPDQIQIIKNLFSETIDDPENLIHFTRATYNDGSAGRLNFSHTSIHDNKYFNWKCSAGSTSVSVNVLGHVHAGLCKQQLIGTIDNFQTLTEYLNCRSLICQCPTDLLIPKYKQNE